MNLMATFGGLLFLTYLTGVWWDKTSLSSTGSTTKSILLSTEYMQAARIEMHKVGIVCIFV